MLVNVSVLLSFASEQLHDVMITSQPSVLLKIRRSGIFITIRLVEGIECCGLTCKV